MRELVLHHFVWVSMIMNMGELLLTHGLRDGVNGLFKTFIKIWLDTG